MNQLVAWFARSPVAANVLMLIIISLGLMNLGSMQRDTLPKSRAETVTVQVLYPGASAQDLEQSVIRVVEERLVGLDDLKDLNATAREGSATISVDLVEGSDASAALAEIRNRVSAITTLPQDAEEPIVSLAEQVDLVAFLILHGPHSEGALNAWATTIQDRLINEGIATRVLIDGKRQREFHIEIDPLTLRSYGLDLASVRNTVASQLVNVPAGTISGPSSEYLMRVVSPRDEISTYANLVIANDERGGQLRLSDVATIRDSFADIPLAVRYHDHPALQLTVIKGENQDVLRADAQLDAFLTQANGDRETQLNGWLPPDLHLVRTFAWADLVKSRLQLLVDNGGIGLLLVFASLWLFTNWRVALWVGAGLGVALLGSLWLLNAQGATINMISMFALIMAIGILVDDAIIVAENIYARLEAGDDPRGAVVRGTQQVLMPIIGATATSMAAFLPLAMVQGRIGDFMMVLPITIVSGLALSLIESFLILPHHLLPAMRIKHANDRRRARGKAPLGQRLRGLRWLYGAGDHLRQGIDDGLRWYIRQVVRPIAHYTVRWRYLVLAAAVAMLLLSVGVIRGGLVPWNFFANPDGDLVTVSVRFPSGTPVTTTAQQTALLEEALDETLHELVNEAQDNSEQTVTSPLRHYTAMIGSLPSNRGIQREGGSHLAGIIVGLSPNEERTISASAIQERWRQRMQNRQLPGLQSLRIEGMEAGPGGSDIDIRFAAPSWDALQRITTRLRDELNKRNGVSNIDDTLVLGTPEILALPNDFGRSLGLSAQTLATQLRAAVLGAEALRLQVGADEVIIRITTPTREVLSRQSIESLPIHTPGGTFVLHEVADLREHRPIAQVSRFNRQRVVAITADLSPLVNTDQILDDLGRGETDLREGSVFAELAASEGARFLFEGVAATQATTMAGLRQGMILAVVTIYLILVLSFRSWLQPVVIITTIPVGFIGAIAGHLIMGIPISIISLFGIVGLTGIVVNDAITFIHFVNDNRRQGDALPKAVVDAICQRFRPIILTTLTTVLGLMPLLLETSTQASFLIPMAAAISFGLIASTVGTLMVIPALYVIIHDGYGLWLWWRRGIEPLHHLRHRQHSINEK